jgi:hypothetical protein
LTNHTKIEIKIITAKIISAEKSNLGDSSILIKESRKYEIIITPIENIEYIKILSILRKMSPQVFWKKKKNKKNISILR